MPHRRLEPWGRRRPTPIEASEFVVECDMVVPAIGQRPSTDSVTGMVEMTAWGGIIIDTVTCATSAEGVFAGGDCVSGGETVVAAIGAGQKAAVAIDRMLGGSGLLPADVQISMRRPSEEDLEKILPRAEEPMLVAEERRGSFAEVLCGLTPDAACAEAGRCLRCDLERLESLAAREKVAENG